MISRSLHVPGSPSSAFTTRYLGLEGGGGREGRYIKGEWEGEEIRIEGGGGREGGREDK